MGGIYQQDYTRTQSTYNVGYEIKKADLNLLRKYSEMANIAEELEVKFLYQLGVDLERLVMADDQTRQEWMDKYNGALEIAKQKIAVKEYPFDKASNVKIPLILQGCVQFNSRIMPEIIQNNKTVYATIAGTPSLADEQVAQRISEHMSLQTMRIVDNWISDTDKLLISLPLVGTVFRKWSYDPISRKPVSFICLPTEIIVSNDVSSLEQAERITHIFRLSRNEIIERIKFGIFREDCLNDLPLTDEADIKVADNNYSSDDDDKELPSEIEDSKDRYIVCETACFIDLDNDGYCEPYTVTWMRKTRKICRIVARFDERDFVLNNDGDLVRINPIIYYAAHHFLPSPDGTFLGMGFGQILLQLNTAINSITNQLVDAGTLANLQGGLISKDLRLRKGEMQFSAGEWKLVNFNAGMGSLSNHIFPLPFKEPSQTLMALLEFLVEFGRQTANISDVLMGNPINSQMPATSVVSLIEQGSKVFNSILTRLYESLKKEFAILYNINKKYITLYPERDLLTKLGMIQADDYENDRVNIYPVANPAMGMDAVRLAKLQVLKQDPSFNQQEVNMRYLVALGIPDPEKLIIDQSKVPPPPEALLMQAQTELAQTQAFEVKMRAAKILRDGDLDALKLGIEEKKIEISAIAEGIKGAIGKANAVANITKAETAATSQQVKQAENVVDAESAKTTVPVDMSGISQAIGQMPMKEQQMMQQQQPQAGQGGQEGGSGLPPELEQMMKAAAQQQ